MYFRCIHVTFSQLKITNMKMGHYFWVIREQAAEPVTFHPKNRVCGTLFLTVSG